MTMLFSVTASAAVMILCGLLLRALLRHRIPAGFFRALWILTALRCLIFAEIPSPVSILTLVQSGKHAAPGTFTGAWQAVIPFSGESAPALSPQTADPFFPFWLSGVILLAAAVLLPHLRFCRRLKTAAAATWEGRRILVMPGMEIPCAVGLFRPAVCLPAMPEEYPPDTLSFILAHENAHIRRGDLFVKWLFTAALCLHWFNPAIWALYVIANRDLEFACDEAVIRRMGGGQAERCRYASVLLDQMEARSHGVPTVPAMAAGAKQNAKERIFRMIQPKKTSVILLVIAILLCASVTAVFAAVPPEMPASDSTPAATPADTAADTPGNIPADIPAAPPSKTEETEKTPADSLPEANVPADADSLTLLFPLPADCTWEITAPFGTVAYIPTQAEEKPPFYYLSRIPDPTAKDPIPCFLVTDHDGVDLAAAEGTAVLAVADAVVLNAGWDYEKGNYVILDCGGGIAAEYRHMAKLSVSEGDTVSAGAILGEVGRTGNATGPHLHFSLVMNGEYVDPMLYYKPAGVYADQAE